MIERPERLPLDVADWSPGYRRWHNQPLERQPDVLRTRALWRALLAIVIAALPAAAYLLEQNECLKLTYAVSELRAEQSDLAEEERRLTGRYASLESLTGIERWAENHGLERPGPGGVVVLRDAAPRPGDPAEAIAAARIPDAIRPVND